MSESFYDELDALTARHRDRETAEKREQETEERFKRLESRFDDLGNLINERIPEKSPAAGNSEPSAGEKGEEKPDGREADPPPPTPEPEMNVERIKHYTVPRIYAGDDEPEIVQYVDAEDGETKTRKGRRKNHPTSYDVQIVMDEPLGDRPQEPGEQTA
jgi:hypothetical protein